MRDVDHPFFKPLWRRVALVVFCMAWSVFEFWNSAPFWGVLAGGMGLYAAWMFLWTYKPPAENPPPDSKE